MLADIFILHPDCDAVLKVEDKLFSSDDVLKYLSGLVIAYEAVPETQRASVYVGDVLNEDWTWIPKVVKVRPAHFSIKEYLTSSRMLEGPMSSFSFTDADAHLWIARSCIAYHKLLSSSHFDHVSTKHDRGLHRYACLNWPVHLEMNPCVSWPTEVIEDVLDLLSVRSLSLQKMITFAWGNRFNLEFGDFGRMLLHPHCYTARHGYLQLTNLLLSPGSGVNRYRTQEDLDMALQDAAYGGSKAIVEKLLFEGANVNAKGMPFGNALWAAASNGHAAVVDLLLDKGADIEAEGRDTRKPWRPKSSTPLQIAGQEGQLTTMELLISRGAKINHTPDGTRCILGLTMGHPECFRYLLENGADVNAVDNDACALYYAARGYWDQFDLLLDKGADVNICGKFGYPLHGLMSPRRFKGNKAETLRCILERTKRLLDLGADPNVSTETSGTPLYLTCTDIYFSTRYECMAQVAQLLIERGADVDIFREKYGNVYVNIFREINGIVYQADDFRFDSSVMKLLLDNGADISTWAQLGEYGSILHAACYARNLLLVKLLLDRGADVHSRGGVFDSVLQAACGPHLHVPNIDILKLLLDCGVDVNTQGGKYGTALQAACVFEHPSPRAPAGWVDIARFLLDHGADVNLEGGEYGTALQAACATDRGNFDIVRLLLERGANILSVGGKYGSAWHAAAQNAYARTDVPQLLQLLHEHGSKVNHVLPETYPYATALHAVFSQQWYAECGENLDWKIHALETTWASRIQFLLDLGADVNLAGGLYGLPLQAACAVEPKIRNTLHAVRIYANLESLSHGTMTILTSKNCQRIDVNAQSGIFGTALQAAAYSGQKRSIHMLLERGAQIGISGGKYRNALNAAIIRGHWDIVDILLARGREQGCQFVENGDEGWLEQIRCEHGAVAIQRWEKFWKVHGKRIV